MTPSRNPIPFAGLVLALVASLVGTPLEAQYFGRNNPQYRTFDFQVLRTEHFDIFYYPEAEVGVRDAARMAERWYARLSTILGHEFEQRQPLILYASHADFQQTNILGSPVGEGTGGVTESLKQRVIMPLAHAYGETDHVLGHEIVHAFQYDLSGLGRSGGSIDAGARALAEAPLWFVEGMAEYLTLGPVDAHTSMWLRDAALTGRLPTLQQLATDPRIFPYRYGHALWAYITGRWGDAVVGQILHFMGDGAAYQQAMEQVLGTTLDQLSADWQAAVRRTYLPLLTEWEEPSQAAEALVTRQMRGGQVNVGPALSPDGRRLAFLSERGFLDIELWLADAETGEVVRRLVRGAVFDTHFGSLNFIASAGSFSPDGRQLAFSALRRGRNVIALVDVERARVVRQFEVPGVPEITNPDWSPDGQRIVFSGSRGGLTSLYMLDLATGETEQLTTGRNADLMPAFSPDGGTIAFTTDRGAGSDVENLRFEGYRIALLDLATGEIEIVPGTGLARNINPVWTPDGQGLYLVSDREGIANIYRIDLATGAMSQVTRIFQGISGYTELSPALAGARAADRLVFSVFDRGGYNLYRLDGARLAGTPIADAPAVAAVTPAAPDAAPLPAVLPPAPRPTEPAFQRVAGYLADPQSGLPSVALASDWQVEPYRPRLSLDYIGQPMIGFSTGGGFDRGGLYGGIAGVWSDMLAEHSVYGVIQAQGQLDEIGFSTAYLYRPLRWDIGVAAQRVPYISIGRAAGLDPEIGLYRDQFVTFRTFDWQLRGMAQFPFSQARRVEVTAGPRRLTRDLRIQEARIDPATGQLVEFLDTRESADAINLFEAGAALVFDNALFGATSPFAGQRYRFEIAPTVGTYRFITGLADFRRYLWLQPFTLAARGMHFGRYAVSTEAARALGPVFIGYPSLLRGYDYGNLRDRCLDAGRQGLEDATPCEVLDQLFGSRVAVANLELRAPLIQAIVLGGGLGIPPIEGFAFYDAGIAWGEGSPPTGLTPGLESDSGDPYVLSSAGVGARINLLGIAILEAVYARPMRGDRGWHWQFALQPGF